MNSVFKEEEKHLEETLGTIKKIIKSYDFKISEIQSELEDYRIYDSGDRDRKLLLFKDRDRKKEYRDQYAACLPSPYFGRVDLSRVNSKGVSTSYQTYYVGNEGIQDDTEPIVIDWRTPLGNFYYVQPDYVLQNNGMMYRLDLRRQLMISNGKLLECITNYDSADLSDFGDVVDPFLRMVLQDKRRQNRLTDIIKTIQSNQNEIIRLPIKSNFIIQGCAGSGKTMILLHRLSYLVYNNKNLPLSQVKILTPNKYFNLYINDLSKELGLDGIERLTVEEFYALLIQKFTRAKEEPALVVSEKGLKEELLRVLYSKDFQTQIFNTYHDFWNTIISALKNEGIISMLDAEVVDKIDFNQHTEATYVSLFTAFNKVVNDSERNKKRKADAKQTEKVVAEEEAKLQIRFSLSEERVASEESKARAAVAEAYSEKEGIIKQLEEEIAVCNEKIGQSKAKIARYKELLNGINSAVNGEQAGLPEDAAAFVEERCGDSQRIIEQLQREYDETPAYNFTRRNKIKAQISVAQRDYDKASRLAIKEYYDEAHVRIEALNANILAEEQHLATLNEESASIKAHLVEANKEIDLFKIINRDVNTSLFVDLYSKYDKKKKALVDSLVSDFISASLRLRELEKEKTRLERRKLSVSQEVAACELLVVLSEAETELLAKARLRVDELRYENIYRNTVLQEKMRTYEEYGVEHTSKEYRHKRYLKLLFCSLYFEKQAPNIAYLNIDEAQDLAVTEYMLLKTLMDSSCVFNLYGDVNQLVYGYKGVEDWRDISFITEDVRLLNENYRNSVQITEFCNNEFGASVYPIGIAGEDVEEFSLEKAINVAKAYKLKSPDKRVAIIHRGHIVDVRKALISLVSKTEVSFDIVDDSKISILSVEAAKGLEFDCVIAIVNKMFDNEKYISFTRALDKLIVVRDTVFDTTSILKNLIDTAEFARRVNVQQSTIERCISEGKMKPKLTVPLNEDYTIAFFEESAVDFYSGKFDWKVIDKSGLKMLFMDSVEKMTMSYSYKPILLKAIFDKADDLGRASVVDIVAYFNEYYAARRRANKVVERENSIFAQAGYSNKEAEKNILSNPFKRFAEKGMMHHMRENNIIEIDAAIWTELIEEEKQHIIDVCDKSLENYYARLEK